ncbi:MAG: hypothetical protein ACP5OG_05055 [Candidatus Nanoarchaeia archaeon]
MDEQATKETLDKILDKINKLEDQIAELEKKFKNHRHDGHGYTF